MKEEQIKPLIEVLGSEYCTYSVIENKLSLLYKTKKLYTNLFKKYIGK